MNVDNEHDQTDLTGWYKETPLSRDRSICLFKLDIPENESESVDLLSCQVTRLCFEEFSSMKSRIGFVALS